MMTEQVLFTFIAPSARRCSGIVFCYRYLNANIRGLYDNKSFSKTSCACLVVFLPYPHKHSPIKENLERQHSTFGWKRKSMPKQHGIEMNAISICKFVEMKNNWPAKRMHKVLHLIILVEFAGCSLCINIKVWSILSVQSKVCFYYVYETANTSISYIGNNLIDKLLININGKKGIPIYQIRLACNGIQ